MVAAARQLAYPTGIRIIIQSPQAGRGRTASSFPLACIQHSTHLSSSSSSSSTSTSSGPQSIAARKTTIQRREERGDFYRLAYILRSVPYLLLLCAATAMKTTTTTFFRLLIFSGILLVLLFTPDYGLQAARLPHREGAVIGLLHKSQREPQLEGFSREGFWARRDENARRLMIGSTAPTCSYNECRGCRFKCRAEQVPVDANDPINSAYHYRCVCHR